MFRTLLVAAAALMPLPAAASSNAANYLIAQEIALACEGGAGSIEPASAVERDLTGDGRADLVIAQEGITCAGRGRSIACGMQVCSVMVYVRRGALLEPVVDDLLGQTVTVGDGAVPEIRWFGHGGTPHTMRWNEGGFRWHRLALAAAPP